MISDTLPGTTETVGAEGLKEALIKGAEYLIRNHRILDNLNVFPVPDGDTGSNMVATLQAGIQTLSTSPISSMGDISRCMIDQLVRNSRGNSGFIIAWFFSGFFKAAERYEYFTKDCLLEGFTNGSYQVNTSLFTPVEGTMITIISAMTKALKECGSIDLRASLREALAAGRETLFNTPKMLPLLAKAGVVDSGALGFIFIMGGCSEAVARGDHTPETKKPTVQAYLRSEGMDPLPRVPIRTEVYVSTTGDATIKHSTAFSREGNSIAL
jgi:dihydroxyacetone kinase-like predicted kinase